MSCQFLQIRCLFGSTTGGLGQDVRFINDDQGFRTQGEHGEQVKEIRLCQNALDWTRSAQTLQGVLHPYRIHIDTFLAFQALRWMCEGLRSRQSGDTGNPVIARSSRYLARLCRAQGEHQANPHRASGKRVPPLLHRLLVLRQQEWLAG